MGKKKKKQVNQVVQSSEAQVTAPSPALPPKKQDSTTKKKKKKTFLFVKCTPCTYFLISLWLLVIFALLAPAILESVDPEERLVEKILENELIAEKLANYTTPERPGIRLAK